MTQNSHANHINREGGGGEEREIDSLRSNAKGARGVVLNGYVEDVTSGAKLSISSIYRGGGGEGEIHG